MVDVSQVDRDAADAFFRNDAVPMSVKMVLGYDPASLIEAFARHREAQHEADRARIAALEEVLTRAGRLLAALGQHGKCRDDIRTLLQEKPDAQR